MAEHGTFYWNERLTRRPRDVCDFYARTLGWRFEEMQMAHGMYYIARQGEKPVAGVVELKSSDLRGVPEQWFEYIAVDDLDKRLAAATQAGARILREPFEIEGVGRIAILEDPAGAAVGWITPRAG